MKTENLSQIRKLPILPDPLPFQSESIFKIQTPSNTNLTSIFPGATKMQTPWVHGPPLGALVLKFKSVALKSIRGRSASAWTTCCCRLSDVRSFRWMHPQPLKTTLNPLYIYYLHCIGIVTRQKHQYDCETVPRTVEPEPPNRTEYEPDRAMNRTESNRICKPNWNMYISFVWSNQLDKMYHIDSNRDPDSDSRTVAPLVFVSLFAKNIYIYIYGLYIDYRTFNSKSENYYRSFQNPSGPESFGSRKFRAPKVSGPESLGP